MRVEEIRLKVREILAKAKAACEEHLAKGLCLGGVDGVFCHKPVKGGDAGPLDSTHCVVHAREHEIELLAEDQADDDAGRMP